MGCNNYNPDIDGTCDAEIKSLKTALEKAERDIKELTEWRSRALSSERLREKAEAENKRLREALEMTVGFCVNLRERHDCWEKHMDAGHLFALAKKALAKTEEG